MDKEPMSKHAIKDKFYLRFNHGGYRRKPKFELRNVMPEGLGNLIAIFGEEHKEYAEFILDACNNHNELQARLSAVSGALRELCDRYIANEGTKHEFICCVTPERKDDPAWQLWTKARAALASIGEGV